MNPLTCVSGYWRVKNKHENKFDKWFCNTLRINCPYVFFSDEKTNSDVVAITIQQLIEAEILQDQELFIKVDIEGGVMSLFQA